LSAQVNVSDEPLSVEPGAGLVIAGAAFAVPGRNIDTQTNNTIKTYRTGFIVFFY
jgi:hypothetical protein